MRVYKDEKRQQWVVELRLSTGHVIGVAADRHSEGCAVIVATSPDGRRETVIGGVAERDIASTIAAISCALEGPPKFDLRMLDHLIGKEGGA